MLTVRDIAGTPGVELDVVAGAAGLDRPVSWIHVSELTDPTPWLEGGEFLLTTGLGLSGSGGEQRAYVRTLAENGVAGLGFGVGFAFAAVPSTILEEAELLRFPVLRVPYELPFVAVTKAAFRQLAGAQLEQLTSALAVHERLADAVVRGHGAQEVLSILGASLGCSLALVDDSGRVLAERHGSRRLSFDRALELPVVANGEHATLRAARESETFGAYDRLVLHHGQTALAFELSRSRAVSAAELRLAGDLLDDLESDRIDERDAERRLAAFGLDPHALYVALVAHPLGGGSIEDARRAVAAHLDAGGVPYLSAARRDRAAFLAAAPPDEMLELAARMTAGGDLRVAVGREAGGTGLRQSLVEARAALETTTAPVTSFRDLGSLELLLSLPTASLEAFADRVLGGVREQQPLIDSLSALLDHGCRWSDAASALGVHRHTLRYRMDRLHEETGFHPDDPDQRLDLWLALKGLAALRARSQGVT